MIKIPKLSKIDKDVRNDDFVLITELEHFDKEMEKWLKRFDQNVENMDTENGIKIKNLALKIKEIEANLLDALKKEANGELSIRYKSDGNIDEKHIRRNFNRDSNYDYKGEVYIDPRDLTPPVETIPFSIGELKNDLMTQLNVFLGLLRGSDMDSDKWVKHIDDLYEKLVKKLENKISSELTKHSLNNPIVPNDDNNPNTEEAPVNENSFINENDYQEYDVTELKSGDAVKLNPDLSAIKRDISFTIKKYGSEHALFEVIEVEPNKILFNAAIRTNKAYFKFDVSLDSNGNIVYTNFDNYDYDDFVQNTGIQKFDFVAYKKPHKNKRNKYLFTFNYDLLEDKKNMNKMNNVHISLEGIFVKTFKIYKDIKTIESYELNASGWTKCISSDVSDFSLQKEKVYTPLCETIINQTTKFLPVKKEGKINLFKNTNDETRQVFNFRYSLYDSLEKIFEPGQYVSTEPDKSVHFTVNGSGDITILNSEPILQYMDQYIKTDVVKSLDFFIATDVLFHPYVTGATYSMEEWLNCIPINTHQYYLNFEDKNNSSLNHRFWENKLYNQITQYDMFNADLKFGREKRPRNQMLYNALGIDYTLIFNNVRLVTVIPYIINEWVLSVKHLGMFQMFPRRANGPFHTHNIWNCCHKMREDEANNKYRTGHLNFNILPHFRTFTDYTLTPDFKRYSDSMNRMNMITPYGQTFAVNISNKSQYIQHEKQLVYDRFGKNNAMKSGYLKKIHEKIRFDKLSMDCVFSPFFESNLVTDVNEFFISRNKLNYTIENLHGDVNDFNRYSFTSMNHFKMNEFDTYALHLLPNENNPTMMFTQMDKEIQKYKISYDRCNMYSLKIIYYDFYNKFLKNTTTPTKFKIDGMSPVNFFIIPVYTQKDRMNDVLRDMSLIVFNYCDKNMSKVFCCIARYSELTSNSLENICTKIDNKNLFVYDFVINDNRLIKESDSVGYKGKEYVNFFDDYNWFENRKEKPGYDKPTTNDIEKLKHYGYHTVYDHWDSSYFKLLILDKDRDVLSYTKKPIETFLSGVDDSDKKKYPDEIKTKLIDFMKGVSVDGWEKQDFTFIDNDLSFNNQIIVDNSEDGDTTMHTDNREFHFDKYRNICVEKRIDLKNKYDFKNNQFYIMDGKLYHHETELIPDVSGINDIFETEEDNIEKQNGSLIVFGNIVLVRKGDKYHALQAYDYRESSDEEIHGYRKVKIWDKSPYSIPIEKLPKFYHKNLTEENTKINYINYNNLVKETSYGYILIYAMKFSEAETDVTKFIYFVKKNKDGSVEEPYLLKTFDPHGVKFNKYFYHNEGLFLFGLTKTMLFMYDLEKDQFNENDISDLPLDLPSLFDNYVYVKGHYFSLDVNHEKVYKINNYFDKFEIIDISKNISGQYKLGIYSYKDNVYLIGTKYLDKESKFLDKLENVAEKDPILDGLAETPLIYKYDFEFGEFISQDYDNKNNIAKFDSYDEFNFISNIVPLKRPSELDASFHPLKFIDFDDEMCVKTASEFNEFQEMQSDNKYYYIKDKNNLDLDHNYGRGELKLSDLDIVCEIPQSSEIYRYGSPGIVDYYDSERKFQNLYTDNESVSSFPQFATGQSFGEYSRTNYLNDVEIEKASDTTTFLSNFKIFLIKKTETILSLIMVYNKQFITLKSDIDLTKFQGSSELDYSYLKNSFVFKNKCVKHVPKTNDPCKIELYTYIQFNEDKAFLYKTTLTQHYYGYALNHGITAQTELEESFDKIKPHDVMVSDFNSFRHKHFKIAYCENRTDSAGEKRSHIYCKLYHLSNYNANKCLSQKINQIKFIVGKHVKKIMFFKFFINNGMFNQTYSESDIISDDSNHFEWIYVIYDDYSTNLFRIDVCDDFNSTISNPCDFKPMSGHYLDFNKKDCMNSDLNGLTGLDNEKSYDLVKPIKYKSVYSLNKMALAIVRDGKLNYLFAAISQKYILSFENGISCGDGDGKKIKKILDSTAHEIHLSGSTDYKNGRLCVIISTIVQTEDNSYFNIVSTTKDYMDKNYEYNFFTETQFRHNHISQYTNNAYHYQVILQNYVFQNNYAYNLNIKGPDKKLISQDILFQGTGYNYCIFIHFADGTCIFIDTSSLRRPEYIYKYHNEIIDIPEEYIHYYKDLNYLSPVNKTAYLKGGKMCGYELITRTDEYLSSNIEKGGLLYNTYTNETSGQPKYYNYLNTVAYDRKVLTRFVSKDPLYYLDTKEMMTKGILDSAYYWDYKITDKQFVNARTIPVFHKNHFNVYTVSKDNKDYKIDILHFNKDFFKFYPNFKFNPNKTAICKGSVKLDCSNETYNYRTSKDFLLIGFQKESDTITISTPENRFIDLKLDIPHLKEVYGNIIEFNIETFAFVRKKYSNNRDYKLIIILKIIKDLSGEFVYENVEIILNRNILYNENDSIVVTVKKDPREDSRELLNSDNFKESEYKERFIPRLFCDVLDLDDAKVLTPIDYSNLDISRKIIDEKFHYNRQLLGIFRGVFYSESEAVIFFNKEKKCIEIVTPLKFNTNIIESIDKREVKYRRFDYDYFNYSYHDNAFYNFNTITNSIDGDPLDKMLPRWDNYNESKFDNFYRNNKLANMILPKTQSDLREIMYTKRYFPKQYYKKIDDYEPLKEYYPYYKMNQIDNYVYMCDTKLMRMNTLLSSKDFDNIYETEARKHMFKLHRHYFFDKSGVNKDNFIKLVNFDWKRNPSENIIKHTIDGLCDTDFGAVAWRTHHFGGDVKRYIGNNYIIDRKQDHKVKLDKLVSECGLYYNKACQTDNGLMLYEAPFYKWSAIDPEKITPSDNFQDINNYEKTRVSNFGVFTPSYDTQYFQKRNKEYKFRGYFFPKYGGKMTTFITSDNCSFLDGLEYIENAQYMMWMSTMESQKELHPYDEDDKSFNNSRLRITCNHISVFKPTNMFYKYRCLYIPVATDRKYFFMSKHTRHNLLYNKLSTIMINRTHKYNQHYTGDCYDKKQMNIHGGSFMAHYNFTEDFGLPVSVFRNWIQDGLDSKGGEMCIVTNTSKVNRNILVPNLPDPLNGETNNMLNTAHTNFIFRTDTNHHTHSYYGNLTDNNGDEDDIKKNWYNDSHTSSNINNPSFSLQDSITFTIGSAYKYVDTNNYYMIDFEITGLYQGVSNKPELVPTKNNDFNSKNLTPIFGHCGNFAKYNYTTTNKDYSKYMYKIYSMYMCGVNYKKFNTNNIQYLLENIYGSICDGDNYSFPKESDVINRISRPYFIGTNNNADKYFNKHVFAKHQYHQYISDRFNKKSIFENTLNTVLPNKYFAIHENDIKNRNINLYNGGFYNPVPSFQYIWGNQVIQLYNDIALSSSISSVELVRNDTYSYASQFTFDISKYYNDYSELNSDKLPNNTLFYKNPWYVQKIIFYENPIKDDYSFKKYKTSNVQRLFKNIYSVLFNKHNYYNTTEFDDNFIPCIGKIIVNNVELPLSGINIILNRLQNNILTLIFFIDKHFKISQNEFESKFKNTNHNHVDSSGYNLTKRSIETQYYIKLSANDESEIVSTFHIVDGNVEENCIINYLEYSYIL